jgi:hypothetical protein
MTYKGLGLGRPATQQLGVCELPVIESEGLLHIWMCGLQQVISPTDFEEQTFKARFLNVLSTFCMHNDKSMDLTLNSSLKACVL